MMDAKMKRLNEAVGMLQHAMMDAGLQPMTGIMVDHPTGDAIRSMKHDYVDYRLGNWKDYCGHICGVPFFVDEPIRKRRCSCGGNPHTTTCPMKEQK